MLNKPDTVVQTHKSQIKKLNLEAPYDTAIPFVNIHLTERKPGLQSVTLFLVVNLSTSGIN